MSRYATTGTALANAGGVPRLSEFFGIVIAMFKNKETMNINEIDLMKW